VNCKRFISIVISLILILAPLTANVLVYESASGILTKLNVGERKTSTNPIARINQLHKYLTGEYWELDGFLGRLVYTGEPIELTFTNAGPIAEGDGTSTPRFYYTYSGYSFLGFEFPQPDVYREVVFITRVKGLLQDGETQDDYIGSNAIIEYPSDILSITRGAGRETVEIGESANQRYFESILRINGEGVSSILSLEGSYTSDSYLFMRDPASYSFGIERVAPDYIPFEELKTKTTLTNSYLAGYVHLNSTDVSGKVSFHSNFDCSETTFLFAGVNPAESFGYTVVFEPVICNNVSGPTSINVLNSLKLSSKILTSLL